MVSNTADTVLVIDDESATLTMFRLFLGAYGYRVLTADSGEQGLDLVRKHRPGIVFSDLKMPGMDGFEILRQVTRDAPGTAVIVITGHGDMDHVIRALNLGAVDFINKPIGRGALEAALGRARARRSAAPHSGSPIAVEISPAGAVVAIRETLTGKHREMLTAALQQAGRAGAETVTIRFDDHAAVDGAGIALLTRLIAEARAGGTAFQIAGLNENFRIIFDMVGITRLAPCIDPPDASPPSIPPA